MLSLELIGCIFIIRNHAEGIVIHILTLIWVPTVFIVTIPGGAASLLGNTYFTTWGCSFSVVGTLVWWQRTWREGIFEMIEEQQNEYEKAKRSIRRREEKRLSASEELAANNDEDESIEQTSCRQDMNEESELGEESSIRSDEDVLHQHLEEDNYSIPSTDYRPRLDSDTSSVTSTSPNSGARCSSKSLFVSALSALPSHDEENNL